MDTVSIPVLIVEDEYLIRSLIRNSIDWEALGFQIVGEAEDGEQALELVKKIRPRLLIVDINIPFVNGIELATTVRLQNPHIQIIILTGYEEFQYARKALQVGVLSYLLKPLNPEELIQALSQAKQTILKDEWEIVQKFGVSNQGLGVDVSIVKTEFLRSLLKSPLEEQLEARLQLYKVQIPQIARLGLSSGKRILDPVFRNLLPRNLVVFPDESGRLVLLLPDDPGKARMQDTEYYGICRILIEKGKELGEAVTVGISGSLSQIDELPRAYHEAEQALEEKFYKGSQKIYLFDPSTQKQRETELPPIVDKRQLLIVFREMKRVKETVSTLLDQLKAIQASRKSCELVCIEIISVLQEYFEEQGIDKMAELLKKDIFLILESLDTFSSFKTWLLQFVEEALLLSNGKVTHRTRFIVQRAKEFMERNYAKKSLTLEQIADVVNVAPNYLSTVFKKELRVSVIEYLTSYRLKKAKELLDEDPLLTITEVAEKVGYMDPYYFSKCFRKQYGLAPSFYLRRKNGT